MIEDLSPEDLSDRVDIAKAFDDATRAQGIPDGTLRHRAGTPSSSRRTQGHAAP